MTSRCLVIAVVGSRVSAFARRALHGQLDQRDQPGTQPHQARDAADAAALGAFAGKEAHQRDRRHAPQRRVLDAQAVLPVVAHVAHLVQGRHELLGLMPDFLAVHFHAQADQGFAHFPA